MVYKIGDGKTRAQVIFALVARRSLADGSPYRILTKLLSEAVAPAIAIGDITEYIAFVEDLVGDTKMVPRNVGRIDGQIEFRTQTFVRSKLLEKEEHRKPEYRKAGNVSTHPKQFLKPSSVVVVIGTMRFLTDTVDLLLERQGALKEHTIEVLKEVADLVPNSPKGATVQFIHLHIADRVWYRGYIEALGKTTSTRRTTEEFLEFIETEK